MGEIKDFYTELGGEKRGQWEGEKEQVKDTRYWIYGRKCQPLDGLNYTNYD